MHTSASSPEPRFLHLLERDAQHNYPLAGRVWHGDGHLGRDKLVLHIEDFALGYLMLDISLSDREPGRYYWSWCLLLVEGVYARHAGTADSVEEAAAAALAYHPDIIRDEINGHQWLRLSPNKWMTHFDGQQAEIRKDVVRPGYRWERAYPPAAAVAACLTHPSAPLCGIADTPELAMLAAEHAPADLRRACAALIVATRPATPEN